MDRLLLTLFDRIALPRPTAGAAVDPAHVLLLNAEVATFGFGLDDACLNRLRALGVDGFHAERRRLLALLAEVTGADARHQALFARFPYETPDQRAYLDARLSGYLHNLFGVAPDEARALSCGHVIDLKVFDLEAFGACPICQRQVDELPYRPHVGNAPFERLTPLRLLGLAADAELTARANALLARPSSLSADEKAFLRLAAERFELRLPPSLFKETLPFAYALFGREAVTPHLSGATDVLRILVFVSDPENGDLSLAAPTRLALRARHVKDALAMLDGLRDVAPDLLRHPGRWKIFARDAHVGKKEFRRRYPDATAAFDKLLSRPKTIETFGRAIEPLIRGDRIAELTTVLAARPGEFMRRIDLMLRRREDPAEAEAILDSLRRVVPRVATRLLFEVRKHLEHRDGAVGQRVFLPKGATTRVQVEPDRRPGIRDEDLLGALEVIGSELRARLGRLEPMGSVYLDPGLAKIVMPYNRRGDAGSSAPVAKGSRYPFSREAEVIRLFVHWRGAVDIDLSAVTFSERFEALSQVSWTNLAEADMRHSGDIQSAPEGASEFIDIRLAALEGSGARYVAASAISFTGQVFGGFPVFAGFMERDRLGSGAVYEPQSVSLKFALPEGARSALTLLFDVREREVIFADLATGGGVRQAVASQREKLQALVRMTVDLPNAKPTAFDVLKAHAEARGALTDRRDDADQVFLWETLDLEAVSAMMA